MANTILQAIQRKIKAGIPVGGGGSNMSYAPNMSTTKGPVYVPPPSAPKQQPSYNMSYAPNMSTTKGPAYVPPGGSKPTVYYPTGSSTPTSWPSSGGGSSGGGYSAPGTKLPNNQTAFQDISQSDVAQQGRGEKDTYARRFGYGGWDEMMRAINEPAPNMSTASGSVYAPPPSQPSLMESIARKLQGSGVGNLIRPSSSVSAQTPQQNMSVQPSTSGFNQGASPNFLQNSIMTGSPFATSEQYKKPEEGGLWGAIKRKAGGALDVIGQTLNLPEWGMSENWAGQPTVGTGIAPTSVAAGYSLPTLVGTGQTGEVLGDEDLFAEDTAGGGGIITQNPGVGQFYEEVLAEIANTINSMGTEELASFATPEMDSWVQMAKDAGLDDQQATLEAVNKQIQVVSDLLDNLDTDITEESKNFLMTEAQRRRLIATRGKPLRDQLTKLVAGAGKYGVNIKNTLAMLEQQIGMKKTEAQQRLEAQKSVEASKEAKLRGLTSLLPYLGGVTGGQELAAKTQKEIATMKNESDLF